MSKLQHEPEPSAGGASPAAPDAWMHWLPIWHLLFWVTLGVPAVSVLADRSLSGSTRMVTLLLAAALGLWYWAIVIRRWEWLNRVSVFPGALYFSVATGIFGALVAR